MSSAPDSTDPCPTLLADVFRAWDHLANEPREITGNRGAPFAGALHPFIAHGVAQVERAMVSAAGYDICWPEIRRALYEELARRLDRACRRVLVLELHVARLEERLEGETAEARFQHYCALLGRREEWDKLLSEYQVTARSIATITAQLVAAAIELLTRLEEDAAAIRDLLGLRARSMTLIDARGGMSDLHRGGRSVWILSFSGEDGRKARLVYKPRSLAVDGCFQRLLRWVEERSALPPLRAPRTIERESHGWVELIQHAPCRTREEVARFYERQGAFLALLHMLRAIDLHQENVIADGEHPVIIDLEALFHREHQTREEDTAASLATRKLADSVTRVGLLPHRIFGADGDGGMNVGGLRDVSPQQTPFPVPAWDGVQTDEMQWVRKITTLAEAQSLPLLGDEAIPVTAHAADLVAGFESMYRFLLARREELLSPDGPLAPFAAVETRHLLRPTSSYARILHDTAHPDHQRDAASSEALLDVLRWIDGEMTTLDRVLEAEKEDLRTGDIPLFTARPDSCDLWDSRGRRIPGYFASEAMTDVRQRLAAFSEEDLAWQTWLIRASLESLRPHSRASAAASQPASPADAGPSRRPTVEALLAEARLIGERLLATAIVGSHDVTWLSLGGSDDRRHSLSPVGPSLHDGTAGMALFLAYLGHLTEDARFSGLARRIAGSIALSLQRQGDRFPTRLGGFSGEAGQLYVLACLARLSRDPGLLEGASLGLRGFSRLWSDDRHNDIIAGAAGTVLALLTVHEIGRLPDALDEAVRGAEALCDRAGGAIESLWPRETPPLLGFSHGTAGVACALLSLLGAMRTHGHDAPVHRIRALADQALSYERRHFDPAQRNWPALGLPGASSKVAWCHGAPGVALGRTLTLHFSDDTEVRREIEVAVDTTLSSGMGAEPILCHGDLGNLLVVTHAATALQRPDWSALAAHHTMRILANLQRERTAAARPLREATPTLLGGLAGVGHGLLYQACPDVVPPVLGLAPPRQWPDPTRS